MSSTQSLLDFVLSLLSDPQAKEAFDANPDRALADAGLSGVLSEDVADAMTYVTEYHPVSNVGNRDYNVGNHDDGDYRYEGARPVANWRPDPGLDSHAAAVQQLQYVSNNYTYSDSHDTVIDKSVNQSIWNEGNLTQSFTDNSVTATDRSVAAGRNINGDVANGDGNVVGDGNKVGNTSNDYSTQGSFNGNNIADRGGVAGDGNVTNSDRSEVATNGSRLQDTQENNIQNTTVKDSGNTYDSGNTTIKDSGNTDNNSNNAYDSGNTYHNSGNTYEQNTEDSNNTTVDHSKISSTEQNGLVNVNDVDLLSHGNVQL